MQKSKALDRFLNRAARFEVDLELADVVTLASMDGRLSTVRGAVFDTVFPSKHPRLASHKATAHQRMLLFAHLKATLRSAYIKDLYEDFSAYLLEILTAVARAGFEPGRLIGEHRFDIDANTILSCASWDAIVDLVSTSLFRHLEDERSVTKLLSALDKKLGLGLDPTILATALPFLELRHLLVHRDGVADSSFCKRFPSFPAIADQKIRISHILTGQARSAIIALGSDFDLRTVQKKLLASADLKP